MGLIGVQAATSVGSVVTEVAYPLTAPSALTGSVGAIAPIEMTIGLLGQEATVTLGEGIILRYYQKLDPNTSASYTNKTPRTTASYTDKTPRTSASYTDLNA